MSALPAGAQTGSSASPWATIDIGAQYVGYVSSYVNPDNGSEILTPLTLSLFPSKDVKIYGQTEFAHGNYTDSVAGTETISLTALSDTVVGLMANFKSLSVPSLINIGVNIPTGNQAWETDQSKSIVPVEFIDSDYRGRGFGMSLLYGLSLQAGRDQYGLGLGYMYTGAFNPYYGQIGVAAEQLKLGDSAFLSVNKVTDRGSGQSDILRLSAFYFLPTQVNGSNLIDMGPNLNASYSWLNPAAFSCEAGVQYFMNAQLEVGQTQSFPLVGTRLYVAPSYAFGGFTLGARVKYVLSNDLSQSNPLYTAYYDGGGWLFGLEPSLKLKLDSASFLKFNASYDYILALNEANDVSGSRVNVDFSHWTFGAYYEVNL